MTWRDKMEIGLKDDAPFRRDNLPEFEIEGPERPAGPGRSPVVPAARRRASATARPTRSKPKARQRR